MLCSSPSLLGERNETQVTPPRERRWPSDAAFGRWGRTETDGKDRTEFIRWIYTLGVKDYTKIGLTR